MCIRDSIRSVCYIALIAVTKSCAELQNCCAAQFTKLRGRAAAQLRGNVGGEGAQFSRLMLVILT